ncbi:SH3 domain-containing protein [Roseomonas pecuniae]|uniref:SH3 domain-containing protein n=1 Tax=Roseomonas populi TaxID=3121582 RepID=A0ABT1X1B5_9PROT|nr:SH3 domain-containing protein [Roseomonas pecuniae]
MPLPRFAALRAEEVNMRSGPGTRYPIEWTYQRKDLPVQIVREFELWRRIRDMDGTEGWVHQSNLTGRRTLVVAGEERVLRRRPEEGAHVVARLKPGVLGRIRLCEAGQVWCEVQVADYRGWMRRSEFFGAMPEEEIK